MTTRAAPWPSRAAPSSCSPTASRESLSRALLSHFLSSVITTAAEIPNSGEWPAVTGRSDQLRIRRADGQRENRLELELRADAADGLVVWQSKGATTETDYLSLALRDGFLELSFNLGKQRALLIARSQAPVADGQWHVARVQRDRREAWLSVDEWPPVSATSEAGAHELNTDGVLWIGECTCLPRDRHVTAPSCSGGAPGLPTGLPPAYYRGLSGCLRALKVDGQPLQLWAHSSHSHLEACPQH